MVSCGVLSAHQPAEWSSDSKQEVIQELATTHLSEVTEAEGATVVRVREALQRLGGTYRHALCAFVLSLGYPFEDARDLRQGFSAHLLLSA